MAISKRLRYEILRRDNHTCRYCGGVAPDVSLRVDHVVPRALGGSDEPANLVASCHDCNAGKTSSAPDQHVVDDANQRAVEWALAMAQAAQELLEQPEKNAAVYAAFDKAWPQFYRNRIPTDYKATLDQLFAAGLPDAVIADMAQVAAHKKGVDDRWRYFCGCCWTKVRQLQERALEIVSGDQPEKQEFVATAVADPDLRMHFAWMDFDQLEEWQYPKDWHCLCPADSVWRYPDVRHGDVYPCNDPACVAAYGEFLTCEFKKQSGWWHRDIAVMDEADELELVDG